MSSTRIRYTPTDKDGILVSIRNFWSKSTGAMYIVYLDLNNCTFTIKNMVSKRKYHGGENINHLHVLKRAVKRRLQSLGVEFKVETRDISNKEDNNVGNL